MIKEDHSIRINEKKEKNQIEQRRKCNYFVEFLNKYISHILNGKIIFPHNKYILENPCLLFYSFKIQIINLLIFHTFNLVGKLA